MVLHSNHEVEPGNSQLNNKQFACRALTMIIRIRNEGIRLTRYGLVLLCGIDIEEHVGCVKFVKLPQESCCPSIMPGILRYCRTLILRKRSGTRMHCGRR